MNVFPTSLNPALEAAILQAIKAVSQYVIENEAEFISSSRPYGMRANPSQLTTDSRKLTKPRNEWLNWMQRYRSSYDSAISGLLLGAMAQRMIQQHDEEQLCAENDRGIAGTDTRGRS